VNKAHRRRSALHRAGQAEPNGFVESFNGRLRDECLNEDVFASLAEARAVWPDAGRHAPEPRPVGCAT